MDYVKKESLHAKKHQSSNQLHHPHNLNHPEGLPYQQDGKAKEKGGHKAPHTHAYFGITSSQNGHAHLHLGVTSTPIETYEGHVHHFYNQTTFEQSHIHYYEGKTGPAIELPNGYHTHLIEVKTNKVNGHTHRLKCFTEPARKN